MSLFSSLTSAQPLKTRTKTATTLYEIWIETGLGVITAVCILLLLEKNKRDKDRKYHRSVPWKRYFGRTWDDMLFIFIAGVMTGRYLEQFVGLAGEYMGWNMDRVWALFIDYEEAFYYFGGLFGSLIIRGIFSLGKGIISKFT